MTPLELTQQVIKWFSKAAAALLLISFVITPLGDFIGTTSLSSLTVYVSILAGTVIVEEVLRRLAIREAFRMLDVEELSKQYKDK